MSAPDLTEQMVAKIETIALRRAPAEAVGLIFGSRIIELPNRSTQQNNSFTIKPTDIVLALESEGVTDIDFENADLVLWHSHPSGGVGPSRIDMQNKVPHFHHLVVALVAEGAIPTFY